jgi:hypothetical protein
VKIAITLSLIGVVSVVAWLQQLSWVNRQPGTISITVSDPGVRQPTIWKNLTSPKQINLMLKVPKPCRPRLL